MIRIAVLGVGRIGRMHAENIAAHPRATLAGVYDVIDAAAADVSARLSVPAFGSVEEVLASPEVDAILIATSTPTHADLIEKAVAAGKPMLCEKPIDLSLARVDACARRIAGTAVPIMLGFVRRFDPSHRAVRDAVRAGRIGDLHQVVITSRDPGLAPEGYLKVSGGIFRDMTIHDFDMARFVLGEEVVAVQATGSRLVDPAMMERLGDYDTVSITLTTASGKQAVITNSRQSVYGYDQRVEALGTLGMAQSENIRAHHMVLSTQAQTGEGAPLQNFFIDRYREAFAAEIGAFVDAVETGTAPEVGFEDGRQALVLAEAALRSAQVGRTVQVSEAARQSEPA
ncbi:inositol 2-dehydrogenase [Rubellimicrobium aerolatum]|uniref:Inositol 2-dehydrogenase n=1 Tax=Rubellimicrobium aerolatum TaxID=490979 RepID=A0ABW0S8L4_9RHOB|nr:inositol 2-dehydrogenase [Rubellimicrobium aerolatum]MBP1804180.1 myo-inositol 2-dehydrogenase/D-chiro-inositol 1-dehydrogenase [Rubellimicrobium aerolatum]